MRSLFFAASLILGVVPVFAPNFEIFQPGEIGRFADSGVVSSKKSVMIIDAQLSSTYDCHLADRVKSLNKTMKVIYLTQGHIDQ